MGESARGIPDAQRLFIAFFDATEAWVDDGGPNSLRAREKSISYISLLLIANCRNAHLADIFLISSSRLRLLDVSVDVEVARWSAGLRLTRTSEGGIAQAVKSIRLLTAKSICRMMVEGGEPLAHASKLAVAASLGILPEGWGSVKASTLEKACEGMVSSQPEDLSPRALAIANEVKAAIFEKGWTLPGIYAGERR